MFSDEKSEVYLINKPSTLWIKRLQFRKKMIHGESFYSEQHFVNSDFCFRGVCFK